MNWKEVRLEDCCVSITDGDHQPPPKSDTGIPFITIANINSFNKIDFTSSMHVPKDYYFNLNGTKRPSKDDILYSVVGSFGIPVFLKEDIPFVFQRHIALLRPNKDIIYPKFLYYKMLSRDFYQQADTVAIGAAQRTIGLASLRKMTIVFPVSYKDQEKIANALSAYDDLIENNQKQIKLLEEAAQRLYKEWFVDLRFPGHEQTRIMDGVPEGWKRKTVKDCLEYHINGGWGKDLPTSNNRFKGEVIRGTDIQDIKGGRFSDIPIRYHSEKDIVKRILKKYDIIFELSNGNINSIGRTLLLNENILNICGENTICASFCKLLRPINYIHSLILYWEIQDMQLSGRLIPFKKQGANGINNFAFEDFLQHSLLITEDKNIIKMFDSFMQKISVLQNQLFLLTEARDRLLPKLMNGEIEL